jgi:hypothetical protein
MFVFKDWDDLQDNNDKQQYPAQAIVFFLASNGKVSVGWVVLDDYSCISFYDSLRQYIFFIFHFISIEYKRNI